MLKSYSITFSLNIVMFNGKYIYNTACVKQN